MHHVLKTALRFRKSDRVSGRIVRETMHLEAQCMVSTGLQCKWIKGICMSFSYQASAERRAHQIHMVACKANYVVQNMWLYKGCAKLKSSRFQFLHMHVSRTVLYVQEQFCGAYT